MILLPAFLAVDCKWNVWGDWGKCKQACPDGSRTRTRTKSQHAQYGGKQCEEDPEEHTICNRISELENELAQLKEENHLQEEQLHCDVTKCKATAYKNCRDFHADLCGTQNGISCAHLPNGLGNTGCAEGALSPVQGLSNEQTDENWVQFWKFSAFGTLQIAGVEISGGCSARLRDLNGGFGEYVFAEVLLPGFTALKGREETGDYEYINEYGENTGAVWTGTFDMKDAEEINLFCPNV